MLSLPEGVLKALGTHFNRVFKEGAFYTGHWTGEVYDFFAPTPKQFEKEQTDAKVEDILSLYAF